MVWSHTYSCTSWSVKWALGSITTNKASGGDRIPAELFNILKDDALSMPANLENSAGLEEVSFHLNPKEGQCQRMFKVCTIVFISHDSKVMLKVLHARLQQCMNWELPAGFKEAEKTEIKLPTFVGSLRKQGTSKKNLLLLHWLCWSLWLCGSQQTGKYLKRWECQTTLLVSWKTSMWVKKQHLEPDKE